MSTDRPPDQPELIVGIAGPIGVDMDLIAQAIVEELSALAYTSKPIRLTTEMERYPVDDAEAQAELSKYQGNDTYNSYMRKMSYANALRIRYDAGVLARIAIEAIRAERKDLTGSENTAKPSCAYIIRQLKRPEEVYLLRQVYGSQFVLISAYAPEHERKERLVNCLKRELSTSARKSHLYQHAELLIERDASEDENNRGQALRETFHLGDVFVDGINNKPLRDMLHRFVLAIFGKNDISPSRNEYGMYTAYSASLRSADLSRQVGSAIFSSDGELITQGCNEVPKAFGGYYWDLEEPDHRDVKKGKDPNDELKREMLRDVVERLRNCGYLSDTLLNVDSHDKIVKNPDVKKVEQSIDEKIVEHLTAKRQFPSKEGVLTSSKLMDIMEFGRVVHAEMAAICDAARLGRSIKGSTIYCTTFPCHNCSKHILASGIKRVVYLEPYIKSRVRELHSDEIAIERDEIGKVSFVPFMGISPYRYKLIFQKGRRKDGDGTAHEWYQNKKRLRTEVALPTYIMSEKWALGSLLGQVESGS